MSLRCDSLYRVGLNMKWKKTEQGYLVTTGQVAKAGELEYYGYELGLTGADAAKKFTVVRTIEELSKPETLASFNGATLTLLHPDDKEVNAATWRNKSVGHTSNSRISGDFVVSDIYVKDAPAISVLENMEIRELSAGYEPANLIQKDNQIHHINIKCNHVAIVPEGRCGSECRLNDSKKGQKMNLKKIIEMLKGKKTNDSALTEAEIAEMIAALEGTLKELDGKESPEAVAKIQEITAQLTELKAELEKAKVPVNDSEDNGDDSKLNAETLKTENEKLKADNEQLKQENEQLKKELEELKGSNSLSNALTDAKARFPKIELKDAKSARDVQEKVLVGLGVFNDSAAKVLTNEQIQAAYAAAQVAIKNNTSKLGSKLLADSKPKEKHDFTKQFGGK